MSGPVELENSLPPLPPRLSPPPIPCPHTPLGSLDRAWSLTFRQPPRVTSRPGTVKSTCILLCYTQASHPENIPLHGPSLPCEHPMTQTQPTL